MVAGTANAMFRPGASSTVPLVARDVRGANGVLRISEAFTAPGGPAPAGPAPAGHGDHFRPAGRPRLSGGLPPGRQPVGGPRG
ncbi:hypothetical protein AB0G31_27755, partial [Streptomyces fradiae]